MAIVVFGICKECGTEVGEVRLVSRNKGLCLHHFRQMKKPLTKPISAKQKDVLAQDQKMYASIWRKRKHVSELSGTNLGDKMKSIFFSHILPKGNYPRFRHREDNIILLTMQEHHDWEFGDRKDPKWQVVKDRYEALLQEYNGVTN